MVCVHSVHALLGVVAALAFLRIGGPATILVGIAAVLGNSAILAFVSAKGRYPRQPQKKPWDHTPAPRYLR